MMKLRYCAWGVILFIPMSVSSWERGEGRDVAHFAIVGTSSHIATDGARDYQKGVRGRWRGELSVRDDGSVHGQICLMDDSGKCPKTVAVAGQAENGRVSGRLAAGQLDAGVFEGELLNGRATGRFSAEWGDGSWVAD